MSNEQYCIKIHPPKLTSFWPQVNYRSIKLEKATKTRTQIKVTIRPASTYCQPSICQALS